MEGAKIEIEITDSQSRIITNKMNLINRMESELNAHKASLMDLVNFNSEQYIEGFSELSIIDNKLIVSI